MTDLISDPAVWGAFLTLTALELVLGIDNVIFISILVDKLPSERRDLMFRHLALHDFLHAYRIEELLLGPDWGGGARLRTPCHTCRRRRRPHSILASLHD